MDLDDLKYLEPDERERYMKLERLFGTPGWDVIARWAEMNRDEARDRAASAQTWEENRIAVGMRMAYDMFAQLQKVHELEFEELARERRAAKEDEDEPEEL